jgi:ATP-binding cassette subfamily B protein
MSTAVLEGALWRAERLGEAMGQLARAAGLPLRDVGTGTVSAAVARDRDAIASWLEGAAQSLGLDVDPLRVAGSEVRGTLVEASPALLPIGTGDNLRFAAMLHAHGQVASLVGPDGARVRVRLDALTEAVRGHVEPELSARVDRLLDRASVKDRRRARAHAALVDQLVAGRQVDVGWTLGLPPSAPFSTQLRDAGVGSSALRMMTAQLGLQALSLAGWWLVGRGALDGQIAPGWLVAWGLVLISMIPMRAVASWAQGSAALRFAILLKRRLLHGALRLEPEEVRNQGSGELLGRVIESGAVESLVTSGGLATLLAGVEVLIAGAVLLLAPEGTLAAMAFAACLVVTLGLARDSGKRTDGWTQARLDMTQSLVERMVGHRTRLAQEPRDRWHDAEDEQLVRYAARSVHLDRSSSWLQGAIPRAWLVVGVATIAPGFVRGTSSGTGLAVAIGGLVLGYRALDHIAAGVTSLLRARVAWQQARPLFVAGGREERVGSPSWSASGAVQGEGAVLEARDLQFRYPTRHQPVLRGASVKIAPHDRLLLEGPSGGGKSTLGAVLTGLRAPDAGLLLLGGLDPQTLGEAGWRRRVAAAPQFHENHVMSATLAFNLLMGRTWPPRLADLTEAQQVCAELGLGPLLERMPSGIMQMVGDTGWQLSHGERSRVFIARALLQRADVIVLDESFAALDPETLETAMRCVMKRAPALVVIAHP